MELFPMIQPETLESGQELPLCREVAWNFQTGWPLFRGGEPVYVTGLDAVQVWVWKALATVRGRYPIYTWDFGCEIETLVGQNVSAETKRAEAVRYVREALEINPYITEISGITVDFEGDIMGVGAVVKTIYGEVDVVVRG